MKLLNSNLKYFISLCIILFSFNSSARILGQFVGDVQKAAKEVGNNIDWKTCEDNGGGFDPKHVYQVVETGNQNLCDPNDTLVQKYKDNFVYVGGKDNSGKSVGGSGFLIEGCQKILTVGHNFYDKNNADKLNNLMYVVQNNNNHGQLNTQSLKEGAWRQTKLHKDDIALINMPRSVQKCAQINIANQFNSEEVKQLAGIGIEFFILKRDPKTEKLCAQKCEVKTSGNIVKSSNAINKLEGSVEHTCNTIKGDSGAPIFAKTKTKDFLVGIHTAGYEETKTNVFSPISLSELSILKVSY